MGEKSFAEISRNFFREFRFFFDEARKCVVVLKANVLIINYKGKTGKSRKTLSGFPLQL